MIFVVNAENHGQFVPDLSEMHRHRKIVFVDRAGWTIPVQGDSEVDAYDRDETIYLLAKAQPDGEVLASARLLPTTGPHLIADLLAAACRERPPLGPTVWEVSRFCTAPDLHDRRGMRLGLLWEVICGVMEAGLLYGVDQVIFAADRALLPLALGCGWEARTLGPTLRDAGDDVTAVAASITPTGLSAVRRRHGIPAPITRLLTNRSPRSAAPSICKRPLGSAAQQVPHSDCGIGHFCYDWPSQTSCTKE